MGPFARHSQSPRSPNQVWSWSKTNPEIKFPNLGRLSLVQNETRSPKPETFPTPETPNPVPKPPNPTYSQKLPGLINRRGGRSRVFRRERGRALGLRMALAHRLATRASGNPGEMSPGSQRRRRYGWTPFFQYFVGCYGMEYSRVLRNAGMRSACVLATDRPTRDDVGAILV